MARRLSQSLILLILLSMFSFSLLHIMPGDFAELLLIEQMGGELPDAESLRRFKQQNGFEDPLPYQYGRWLAGALQGDLGTSFQSGGNVWGELRLRLANSVLLAGASIAVSLLVAIPLGIGAAARPGSAFDRLAMMLAVFGMAIPNFWYSLLMVLVFSLTLGWLPVSGYGHWTHLVLPALVIGTSLSGVTARFIRSCFLDVLSSDFVRTARAKGLREARVLFIHTLPNALVPIVTLLGMQIGKMFDSVVVVETIFAWPGVGRLLIEAILSRDFPIIQACVLVVGTVYIGINLIVDFIVTFIDPRIRGAV
ncbi:MAG: ABC transporter permease [Rhodospirillales bacterium]|nr:ABC transporter permease [Rhodospirillales bacterium]